MSAHDHLTADPHGVILPCPHCLRSNRVPFSRIHEAGNCGNCKAPLPFARSPVIISSRAEFGALVRDASVPVLVDFWAPWCGPCLAAAPEVSKLADLVAGELLVAKVNTDEEP